MGAAGWGNLGGGVTQFVMPLVYAGMLKATEERAFTAWRWAYIVPGLAHLLGGMAVMFLGQDLPDGNYKLMHTSGALEKKSAFQVNMIGMKNYRMWCMVATYVFCFGVELTMNNIIAPYLFDQFDLNLEIAGVLGSCFGLMNLFARSLGGIASDLTASKYGMRGRLWALWIMQTLEGGHCIVMGRLYMTLPGTLVVMIMFSTVVQMSEGAYYTQDGISYMGAMIIGVTLLVIPIYFPMWGGMFCPPKEGVTESDYYLADFTEEEKAAGIAASVAKFAKEAASERAAVHRPAEVTDKSKSPV